MIPVDLRLEGSVAVVTAGGGGAGRVIAEALAAAGARVVACDIDSAALRELEARQPGILTVEGDVSSESTVGRLFDAAESRFGDVDILVNNVGIGGPTAAVEDVTTEEWSKTLETNLTSHFLCVRRAVPRMKSRRRGVIVNISSGSAKVGLPLRLPYVVSKGALLSMTLNLARELGPHGVRVNAILPGAIRGARINRVIDAKARALGVSSEEYARTLLQYVSLRTLVEPEDIAAMVLFLASSAGQRITGQCIGVDGNIEYEV